MCEGKGHMNKDNPIFKVWRDKYLGDSEELRHLIISDFNQEQGIRRDYQGRELLEMIQNADDQQSASLLLKLVVDENPRLIVKNSGGRTEPFSEDGFRSIMTANLSEKKFRSGPRLIGQKGLGFRSLLNWSTKIEIRSAGVKCDFAEEHAEAAWNEVKKLKCSDEFLKKCETVIRDTGRKCPISILAAPHVDQDVETEPGQPDANATTITVYFNQEIFQNIKDQFDELTPQILLFLRHLEKISIILPDEQERTLQRSEWEPVGTWKDGQVSRCILSSNNDDSVWLKHERHIGVDDVVAVAWKEDGSPVATKSRFVYSYFPTRVRLDLPCVLHATFRLNSSRNSIDPSSNTEHINEDLMFESGRSLVMAAEYQASRMARIGRVDWSPYEMVRFSAGVDFQKPIDRLRDGVLSLRESSRLYPTVGGKYLDCGNSLRFGELLAEVLVASHATSCFQNHLLPGFSKMGINCETRVSSTCFSGEAEKLALATVESDLRLRVQILESFVDIGRRSGELQLSCLTDVKRRMVSSGDVAYINTGRYLVDAPECLGIRYVEPALVEEYCQALNSSPRKLAERLQCVANVSTSEIAQMKKRLVRFSNQGYQDRSESNLAPVECFRRVMKSLYKTFCAEGRSESGNADSLDYTFSVFSEEENVLRKASEVTLWDVKREVGLSSFTSGLDVSNRWRLSGDLAWWCDYLEAERDDVVRFMRDVVHVSLGLPKTYVSCGDDIDYVNDGKPQSVKTEDYSSARTSSSDGDLYAPNVVPIICDDFIAEVVPEEQSLKSVIPFALLLCKDQECYEALTASPNVWYFYVQYRSSRFDLSLMAYRLRRNKRLMPARLYVVEEDLSIDGARLRDMDDVKAIPAVKVGMVLMRLGAAPSLSDMPVSGLYDLLANYGCERGVQKFYRQVREALLKKMPDNAADGDLPVEFSNGVAKLHQLFARKGKQGKLERVSIDQIYYWDNDTISRSLLDKKYKLEIGGRVGEASVARLFGVKRIARESIKTIRIEKFEGLTRQLSERLLSCRPYLLAVRCRELDSDKDFKQAAAAIRNLHDCIKVVSSCRYEFDGDSQDMESGDLLATGEDEYYILSRYVDLKDALCDPQFCMSLVEAVCMRFKLTGSQLAGEFRGVLKNSPKENEFLRKSDLTPEEWERALRLLGLGEEERAMWGWAACQRNVVMSDSLLSDLSAGGVRRLNSIAKIVGRDVPDKELLSRDFYSMKPLDVLALVNWIGYPKESWGSFVTGSVEAACLSKMMDTRDAIRCAFANTLHAEATKKGAAAISLYAERLSNYIHANDWLRLFVGKLKPDFDADELVAVVTAAIESKFDVKVVDMSVKQEPQVRNEYLAALRGADVHFEDLPAEVRSLAYFEGNIESFVQALSAERAGAEDIIETDSSQNHSPILVDVERLAEAVVENAQHDRPAIVKSRKGGNVGFVSDKELRRRGAKAEKLVMAMMDAHKERFLSYIPWSSISSTHGLADDNRHYDFEYETPAPTSSDPERKQKRFLEVKAFSGDRFLMSADEYSTATSDTYSALYDLALVTGEKVYFLTAPFASGSAMFQRLSKTVDTWRIGVKLQGEA